MFSYLARHNKAIAYFFAALLYTEALSASYNAAAAISSSPRYQLYAGLLTERPTVAVPSSASPSIAPPIKRKDEKKYAADDFTTGPTQPEMQSFQSVNANNMVDLFTGDFSYNIPLLDVGGYPINIHYQSGATMDQEASWVGLGWNINPGVITRTMRGLPDDFRGDSDAVRKVVSMKPNRTLGVNFGMTAELFGKSVDITVSNGILHNTYKGWGVEQSLSVNVNAGIGAKGSLTSSLGISNSSQDGLSISPSIGFNLSRQENKSGGGITIGTSYNSRYGIQSLQLTGQVKQFLNSYKNTNYSGGTGITSYISFAKPSFTPRVQTPFTSQQFTFTLKGGGELFGLHPNGFLRGYGSVQRIENEDTSVIVPAFGYLYYEQAKENKEVLLDFNREKETMYRQKTPHIAIPIYTYDTYNISGEGTGGMFRPYRGDIGFVYDNSMTSKSKSGNFSLEFGTGATAHGGTDISVVNAETSSGPWLSGNFLKEATSFREKDSTFENVYFKNPGEKTVVDEEFYDKIGDENLVRVDLAPLNGNNQPEFSATRNLSMFKNNRLVGKRTLTANSLRIKRDKRTQSISYLTASEAAIVGLDTRIKSYNINAFPSASCDTNYIQLSRVDEFKKSYHLSQITVLNPDGRRYIYGLPLYNVSQTEVTMSAKTSNGNNNTGMVKYTPGTDNTTRNTNGKDGYYSREDVPSYAHSFLLSGIISPDYVDIKGDGITEDDNGDAIKFNYSQIYGLKNPLRWRAPFRQDSASYNEGLKTDNRDDKGSYSYGTREVWYLNSVESKSMIATFVLDTDEPRKDSYGVLGENGGRDNNQKLYRLKKINLFTKADLIKNGANAKPIKTVHFEYSYQLCRKNPASVGDSGKLTLKKIWFSYNNNNKGKLNPYSFTYHETNPEHNSKSYDRWGNYKDPSKNPGTSGSPLTNADYPYVLQDQMKSADGTTWDSADAASIAGIWSLKEIKLPSGGKIKVTYESDDYAYVQNKRAMQMFSLAGFGSSSGAAVNSTQLYTPGSQPVDYRYVFINVPSAVNSKSEVYSKYLEGVTKLYFKVLVKMPPDRWGSGYEYVPVYADIRNYGVKGSPSDKRIWIELAPVTSTENPVATAAIQFLRLNLPSKAYPFSEPGDNINLSTAIQMIGTVIDNVKNAVSSFERNARKKNWCNTISLEKSFVRLNNPFYKKLGGGHRVKKVEIDDNWDAMTANAQKRTVFGQLYDYSKVVSVNGVPTTISSGVASFEPGIGNDENPFRVPFKLYSEKEGILAPTDYVYAEEPFAETFFPAPMVGYSKVRVTPLNKDKKSSTGFQETEFYTSQDFPTIVELTPLDNETKKTFNPRINNFFRIEAKNHVTLSQGFKVELNDMNGKVKSQASYAQNDLKNPISYTYNYYRFKNDDANQKSLSSVADVVDSANGVVRKNAQMGKEIELMVDVREQVSVTRGGSLQVNVDAFPILAIPFVAVIVLPAPTSEENRFRSVSVLKVVNKYGLLDSVIHIEKGSRVSTRNMIYDAETGDVLLSQTNNEFDDPIYNFSYPAHWAYSGMSLAYKNLGTVFKKVRFQQGKMFDANTCRSHRTVF